MTMCGNFGHGPGEIVAYMVTVSPCVPIDSLQAPRDEPQLLGPFAAQAHEMQRRFVRAGYGVLFLFNPMPTRVDGELIPYHWLAFVRCQDMDVYVWRHRTD